MKQESLSASRWNLIFRELGQAVSRPTEAHPAARVWKETDLVSLISEIRRTHRSELGSTIGSAREVVGRMTEVNWLRPILLDTSSAARPPARLYLVDMEAAPDECPDTPEVLLGCFPSGFICYFGALAYHELTTQTATHWHIAECKEPSPGRSAWPSPAGDPPTQPSSRSAADPMGTLAFHYDGLPCYITRRDPGLVAGLQSREHGPRLRIRTTNLEQTILDTLLHPGRCGGEAVCIEAWERGPDRWDADRLAAVLRRINRQDFVRRTGAMLEMLGRYPKQGTLRQILEETKRDLAGHPNPDPPIPLLKGLPYGDLSAEWNVLLP